MTFRILKTLALAAPLAAGALLVDTTPADALAIKAWSYGWHPGWFRTSTGGMAYGWHRAWRQKWVHVSTRAPISYRAAPGYSYYAPNYNYVRYVPRYVYVPAAYGPGYNAGYYGGGYGGGGGLFGFLGL
jgi:hypothetical protein